MVPDFFELHSLLILSTKNIFASNRLASRVSLEEATGFSRVPEKLEDNVQENVEDCA